MEPQPTTVLMLSANPKDTGRLRLDQERRDIEAGLERSRLRDSFRLITKTAVRPADLQRAMLDNNPQIVHFSGHGDGEAGLMLEDEAGFAHLVDADALASLFELFADHISCVVLNACYSAVQAEAIAHHIPYVIGMSDKIKDTAAIPFAVAFYDALGNGRDVEFAYKNACVAIKLTGIPQADIPKLHRKIALTSSAQPVRANGHIALRHGLRLTPLPPPPSPSSPPTHSPASPMTSFKRQRLEQQQTALQSEWNLKHAKLNQLRTAYATEAGASVKFQLEQDIKAIEADLTQLEAKLDEIEQALATEPAKK